MSRRNLPKRGSGNDRPIGVVTGFTDEDMAKVIAANPGLRSVVNLTQKQKQAIVRTEHIIGVGGAKFGGKGGTLNSKVLTPFGWKRMGDIKVGSVISNPSGYTSTVIGVFPLGKRKVFKVTFSDGASTVVTDDHLWLARLTARKIKADRRYFPFEESDRVDAKVYTTSWLKSYIDRERENHPGRDQFSNGASAVLVPLTNPVEFSPGNKTAKATVDPYALGLLLGDGCLRGASIGFSSNDQQVVELLRIRTGVEITQYRGSCNWRIRKASAEGLIDDLKTLGVYGCLAHEKFIPDCYKWASVNDRWELIQGLMDTDGYADARGHCSFTSVSERLADDVRAILWTLGFKVSKTVGPAGYRDENGDYVKCRDAFTLYIQGALQSSLFKLSRKSDRVKANKNKHGASSMRRMVSIEPAGEEEAQCIQVDHPNSLYITDDCIVTHNTYGGILWMISGNKHQPGCSWFSTNHKVCDCPYPDRDKNGNLIDVNFSYIYHPKFLGCVLRRNLVDLRDWVREARAMYEPVGGEFKEGEKTFVFPSGAQVFCGHYDEEDAFTKFAGLNIVRFLVEEATHIPNVRKRIQMLRSCNRAVVGSGMVAQMMLTFNPGGVSHGDILDMFVKPKDINGDVIPPGTPITEEYDAREIYARLGVEKPEGVGEKIISTRVFIFSSIKDNPSALLNEDYISALMDLPEEEREAYLFGNWDVLSGEYFKSFRPHGPAIGEPQEANHVIPHNLAMSRLQPWWWATCAMDWGYSHECAFGIGFHDQDRDQLWVTDEMVVSETEPDIVGEEVARRLKPILKRYQEFGQEPVITMGLSHDAYGLRQDDRSVAELIAKGMARVLGNNLVHVPDLLIDKLREQMGDEGQSTASREADEMFDRIKNQKRMGITIRRMRDSRIVGWQLVRSLMRWKNTLPGVGDLFDPNLASRLAYEKGIEAYNAYLAVFEQKREILPKLQLVGPPGCCPKCNSHNVASTSDYGAICESCGYTCHIGTLRTVQGTGLGCSRLINAIPKAIRDELNPEDVTKKHVSGASDLWDMLRYLCMTFRGQSMPEPFEALRRRRIAEARARNPNIETNDLVHLNRKLEADWKAKKSSGKPINVVRGSHMMRARVRGLLAPPGQ